MDWLIARLKEPSTHAALAALAAGVAGSTTGATSTVAWTIAALLGGAGVATAERK